VADLNATTAKQLELAGKRQIATRVVKANAAATCSDVEADAEWKERGYGKCGGTILADGKVANGIAVEHKPKTVKAPPSPVEMQRAIALARKYFGGDVTKTIAFLQHIEEPTEEGGCGGWEMVCRSLIRYNEFAQVRAALEAAEAELAAMETAVPVSERESDAA